MAKNNNQRQIELLKVLAKGCKKHPAYNRAKRKATERREECVVGI